MDRGRFTVVDKFGLGEYEARSLLGNVVEFSGPSIGQALLKSHEVGL
jgi:hypothetical protein